MIFDDVIGQAWRAVRAHRQRSALTMLGIVIGIASVILLTSIGEGARRYIVAEFTQFGTSLISINPGRVETTGMQASVGGTTNPLTLADTEALRRMRGAEKVVPIAMGTAPVERGERTRHVFVYGVTSEAPATWKMSVRSGRFLEETDLRYGSPQVVLGPTVKRELFGDENPLGQHVHIGGRRFLVIGVMESKGQFLGFDIDDAVYIPVAIARSLFNRDELQEIDVLVASAASVDSVAARIRTLLIERHRDHEDFTITTQTGMLESLDRVIRIVSLAVVGIGAISLLVGAIGILTMMWISVSERTAEIGLAKALGATPGQILSLYLAEASLLSLGGGLMGLLAGIGLAQAIRLFVPGLPVQTPLLYVGLALVVCLVVGVASGIMPARRAARLDPVEALAAE